MILIISILTFSILSVAFFQENLMFMYFSGVAALVLSFILLKDLTSIAEILRGEVEEEVRELPGWLTGLGSNIAKFVEVIRYRKDSLEWELSSEDPSIDLSYKDFSSVLAVSANDSFYSEFSNKVFNKFRCNACAIIFDSDDIYLAGDENFRLSESLKSFFRQYFLNGDTARLGFHDSRYDCSGIGEPASFGYTFSLSETFTDSTGFSDRKGLIWLGYNRAPLNRERIWISDLSKKLEGELAAFRTVSALSRKVEEAQEKSAQKTEFISHMSHDIRSPLNNIKSILHVLKLESVNQEHIDLVNVSLANCDSVMEIVEDLLDFTKYQLGELSSKQEVFDLAQVLKEVVANYSHSANSKGLEIITNSELENLYVTADSRQIKRVISNLIANAIKYTDLGKVEISAEYIGSGLELSIQDSGIGMSDEQLRDLFTPFKRFASSKADGIGLGLTLSKIIIEKNLGKIRVDSVLGEGSKFTLSLPAVDPILIDSKQEFTRQQLRVVLVDDNIDFVDSMSRGLRSLGLKVFKAYSITEALQLIKDQSPDYIVSDKNMPGGGLEALMKGVEPLIDAKVLVITGADDKESLELKYSRVKRVFYKPIVASTIFNTLTELESQTLEQKAA